MLFKNLVIMAYEGGIRLKHTRQKISQYLTSTTDFLLFLWAYNFCCLNKGNLCKLFSIGNNNKTKCVWVYLGKETCILVPRVTRARVLWVCMHWYFQMITPTSVNHGVRNSYKHYFKSKYTYILPGVRERETFWQFVSVESFKWSLQWVSKIAS